MSSAISTTYKPWLGSNSSPSNTVTPPLPGGIAKLLVTTPAGLMTQMCPFPTAAAYRWPVGSMAMPSGLGHCVRRLGPKFWSVSAGGSASALIGKHSAATLNAIAKVSPLLKHVAISVSVWAAGASLWNGFLAYFTPGIYGRIEQLKRESRLSITDAGGNTAASVRTYYPISHHGSMNYILPLICCSELAYAFIARCRGSPLCRPPQACRRWSARLGQGCEAHRGHLFETLAIQWLRHTEHMPTKIRAAHRLGLSDPSWLVVSYQLSTKALLSANI